MLGHVVPNFCSPYHSLGAKAPPPMNIDRIRALGPWLAEGKYVWIATGSIALALLICLRPGASEPLIRWTGLVLQLLGVATVVWGISETRALFSHTPIFVATKGWIARFPLKKQSITLAIDNSVHASFSDVTRVNVTHSAGMSPTIESRLDALEKNIAAVHERITGTEKEIDQRLHKANEALSAETADRTAENERTRGMLETTATGGVHISAIGATWLFVGVFLSTAAPELTAWLK